MSKFSLKADHFITPIKLVLPGIIVSLIGASAGYFLFNNPDEKKAKETYRTWSIIKEYESAFKKGRDAFYCSSDSLELLKFHKDYAHLLAILVSNLEDLKGNKEMDPRISAFLNIKIARYKESMKLTDSFLTKLAPLNEKFQVQRNDTALLNKIRNQATVFATEIKYIENRDDYELKRIAGVLDSVHKKYVKPFEVEFEKPQTLNEIRKNVTGSWYFPESYFSIDLKKDSSGRLYNKRNEVAFKWTMKDSLITLNMETTEVFNFIVEKADNTYFTAYWIEQGYVAIIGCRRNYALEDDKKGKVVTAK